MSIFLTLKVGRGRGTTVRTACFTLFEAKSHLLSLEPINDLFILIRYPIPNVHLAKDLLGEFWTIKVVVTSMADVNMAYFDPFWPIFTLYRTSLMFSCVKWPRKPKYGKFDDENQIFDPLHGQHFGFLVILHRNFFSATPRYRLNFYSLFGPLEMGPMKSLSSVRSFVRSRSLNPFIGFFDFSTNLQLNRMKLTFSDFPQKIQI